MFDQIKRNFAGATHPSSRLARAVRKGNFDAAPRALRRGADPDFEILYGTTMLMAAAANGNEQLVRTLLQANAEPNRVSRFGNTALDLAEGSNHAGIVALLLEHDAQPAGKLHNDRLSSASRLHRMSERLGTAPGDELNRRAGACRLDVNHDAKQEAEDRDRRRLVANGNVVDLPDPVADEFEPHDFVDLECRAHQSTHAA